MKRIFMLGGMAIWFLSCSNNGNGPEGSDTSATNVNRASPYTMDTINKGIGAGQNPATTNSGTGSGATTNDSSTTPGAGSGKDTAKSGQ
jgi:hypothetical protein